MNGTVFYKQLRRFQQENLPESKIDFPERLPALSELKSWISLLVYLGLVVIAGVVTVQLVMEGAYGRLVGSYLLLIVILGILFVGFNYFLTHRFPERFLTWNWKSISKLTLFFWLAAPYAYILMAMALSYYLWGWMFGEVRLSFERSLVIGEQTSLSFFLYTVFVYVVVLIFLLIFFLLIYSILQIMNRWGWIGKLAGLTLYLLILLGFIIGVMMITGPQVDSDNVEKLIGLGLKWLVGPVALGWCYELFIGTQVRFHKRKDNED